jgi:polyhydroxyalkanoate synthesis regulator phasin
MAEQQKASDGIRDGFKAGIGILAALKDAIEETIDEMRERGDISPERAKEAVRSTMQRAQEAMGDARDRLDMVSRKEFEALKDEVAALRIRLATHEGGAHGGAPGAPGATGAPEGPHGEL